MAGITKEERFILKLYELLENNNEECLDCFDVGRSIGKSRRFVEHTVRILTQANFIEKVDDSKISLSQGGEALVSDLLGASS